MRRLLWSLFVMAVVAWCPVKAQTARDSAHAKVVRPTSDSIRTAVDTIRRNYPNTLKNSPTMKRMVDRIAATNARIAAAESLLIKGAVVPVPVPVPTPTPTPTPTNQAPVARFTKVCSSTTRVCTVDASTSTDDVGVTLYSWNFGDGLGGSGAIVSHTYAAVGTYTISLTVFDAQGLAGVTLQGVTISGTTPTPTPTPPPPTTYPVPTATFEVVCATTFICSFDGRASAGYKLAYAWDCGAFPNCSSPLAQFSFQYPHEGARTASLTVRDSLGRTASASKTFTVPIAPAPTPTPTPTPTPLPTPSPSPEDTVSIATRAELPRSTPAFTIPPATRSYVVTGDLQRAVDTARAGDELKWGGTYIGTLTLPSRACGSWITLRSVVNPPAPGVRVTPSTATGFGKIVTPGSAAALNTKNPTCGWNIVGLEITGTLPITSIQYGLVWLGDGGWLGGGETQTSVTATPRDIVLDRVYLHGSASLNTTRCLFLNSANTIIRDSYLADCHAAGFDSQAILGCNGAGPYLIENNYLEGAGENVMFGGCDPVSEQMIPSDITIRRNHIRKPLTWKNAGWSIKNLLELKNARRVLIESNVMENSWQASQAGMAIVLKSSTENCGACTWEGTKDVTVRYNIFRQAHRGLNIQAIDGSSAGTTASHTERITVENNLFDQIGTSNGIAATDGWLMLLTHDVKDIRIWRNTFRGNAPGAGLAAYLAYGAGAARRVEITENVYAGQSYFVLAGDGGNHTAALTGFAGASWKFSNNWVSQLDGQFLALNPPGNRYVQTVAELGLRSDGSLPVSLPGADIPGILTRTAGVPSP